MERRSGTHPLRANARVLFASMAGTAVEYYDFYIYATAAALFFGPVFFPAEARETQILLALLSYGIAFVARPVGGMVFGHFGDRVGRKSTLVASLLLMGGCTAAMAFLPTFGMVGWVAPVLLCLLRFGQGFGLGGEWAGAALLSVEYAPKGWKSRFGMTPGFGARIGWALATGVFLLLGLVLTYGEMMEWGWRIPFLASAVLIGIGLWVRLKIEETPEFRLARASELPPRVPIVRLIVDHPGLALAGAASVICAFSLQSLHTTYAMAHLTLTLGYDRQTILIFELISSPFAILGLIVSSMIADRISPAIALAFGSLAAIVLGVGFGPGLDSGSLLLVATTILASGFVNGLCYAPLAAWLSSLFPVYLRYSGVAFAFNGGGIFGGAVTPLLAQSMSSSGNGEFIGLLVSAAALLTLSGVMLVTSVNRQQKSPLTECV